jgi:predicted ATPase
MAVWRQSATLSAGASSLDLDWREELCAITHNRRGHSVDSAPTVYNDRSPVCTLTLARIVAGNGAAMAYCVQLRNDTHHTKPN